MCVRWVGFHIRYGCVWESFYLPEHMYIVSMLPLAQFYTILRRVWVWYSVRPLYMCTFSFLYRSVFIISFAYSFAIDGDADRRRVHACERMRL